MQPVLLSRVLARRRTRHCLPAPPGLTAARALLMRVPAGIPGGGVRIPGGGVRIPKEGPGYRGEGPGYRGEGPGYRGQGRG